MSPLVSIIVPCYNQAQYLSEALQSILDQTYQNWECIIVNDGSPDNTEAVAQEWLAKGSRFKYVYKENEGLSSARNSGIEIAIGEFILPLDADDKIGKDYLKLALQAFENDQTLKVVYCKAEKFGQVLGIWNLPSYSITEIARNNSIFCSAIYRKLEWEKVCGYDTNMIYGLEDWEFWIAILKDGGNVKCIDYIGFYYRITAGSMARIINQEERFFSEKYVAIKHLDFILKSYDELLKENNEIVYKLTSEKFVSNLFTKMFLGFKFFK
ncbi:glycosyltransferase family A protein [Flavobacterium sp. PL12]|uniref:glycosyltransferase family 2 protein n=1 Tax=Flavobacterium sp. PL12 TaxID=3071718 RepID=UPI00319E7C99